MAITLLIVLALASATGYAGLSTALGAFLAGVLLSETEYRHQVEIDLAPFKGLLIGLFFISVGMSIDLRVVWAQIGLIVAGVVALLAVKAILCWRRADCSAFPGRWRPRSRFCWRKAANSPSSSSPSAVSPRSCRRRRRRLPPRWSASAWWRRRYGRVGAAGSVIACSTSSTASTCRRRRRRAQRSRGDRRLRARRAGDRRDARG